MRTGVAGPFHLYLCMLGGMDGEPTMTKLRLQGKKPEAGNVETFIFETGGLTWIAGQNQGYVISSLGPSEDENQRWFTIASAPFEGEIHISTRVSQSGFKQALNSMNPGDTIECHTLEGDFTWEDVGDPVVLVAGGIGSTPFRSILLQREFDGKPLNCKLLYYNRNEEVPFQDEFEALAAQHPEFKLQIIVGETIDAESILRHAPEGQSQTVLLSGPEPMVEAVGTQLKDRGVHVKQDWFPGYDEKSY